VLCGLLGHIFTACKGNGIHRCGIAEEWYKFRDEALKKIAIKWCEENDIRYTDFKVISSK